MRVLSPLICLTAVIVIGTLALPTDAAAQTLFGKKLVTHKKFPRRTKNELAQLKVLRKTLTDIFADSTFDNVFWGVRIESLDRNELIFKLNGEKNFVPASNQKLLTVAAALTYLDTAFRYTTGIYADGKPSLQPNHANGEWMLNGNLIVRGDGNPCISARWFSPDSLAEYASSLKFFEGIADSLLKQKITLIAGDLVADDGAFIANQTSTDWQGGDGDYAVGWDWDDLFYGMASPVSALALNENSIVVKVFPADSVGKPPLVVISPATGYVSVQNQATTGDKKSKRTLLVSRQLGTNNIVLSGELPITSKGYTERIAVEKPSMFFLSAMAEVFSQKGIRVAGKLRRKRSDEQFSYDKLDIVSVYQSPPLLDILSYLNKESDNFLAEQVLRSIGIQYRGEGSLEAGLDAVRSMMTACGVDMKKHSVADGSGLSRKNRISPNAIVALLRRFYRSEKFPLLFQTLPISGYDGTLRERMSDTKADKRVFAKTGYLGGIRTLSGYLKGDNKEWFAFSIMSMNFTQPRPDIEAVQDKALEALAAFVADPVLGDTLKVAQP